MRIFRLLFLCYVIASCKSPDSQDIEIHRAKVYTNVNNGAVVKWP